MDLDVGSTIGDYQIIGILGAGGMGKVFKVRNVISDRVEAMKVLLPDLANEPELADRFIREIKVQASLEHPNIAALHTALRVGNQLLMLMELVEGTTLEQRLQQGPIPVYEGVEYISQVLGALSYAHQHGVIHRDIKPANMMLTPSGTVKLMDFGIAKAASDRKLTMTGTTMGSLYYMSPEQIKGMTSLDARSDLYSVGVSLYEVVTGKRPFDGDSQYAIMAAHLEKTPVPPVEIDPNLPAMLNDVILMSVAKDPAERFQTADAFQNALRNVQASLGGPVVAKAATAAATAPLAPAPSAPTPGQTPAAQPAPGPRRSHRGLWMAVGAICTALAIVAIIQFGPWKKTNASTMVPPAQQTITTPAPATSSPAPAPVTAPSEQTPALSTPVAAQPASQAQVPEKPAPRPVAHPTAASVNRHKSAPLVRSTPPAPSHQVAAQPVQQSSPPPTAAQAPPPMSIPAARPAVDAEAKRKELQQVREQLVMLSARAGSIRSTLQNIRNSQAAGGLGLRSDWLEASTLMGTYLEGAKSALNAGDAPSAKDFLGKAERQVETLERALNK